MARIRSIKPEFWRDRKLARQVSRDARLLYVALWNQADEHGRCDGDPRLIKGQCFPYDDDLSLADIERLLADLDNAGRLQRYDVDGDPYLFLPKLDKHQRLEPSKVPSRLPAPPSTSHPHPDGDPSASRAESSERRAESSETNAALHVAGSREQVAGGRETSAKPPTAEVVPMRRDVETLCSTLVELMIRNGCKPPTITQKWRDAARLLLDRDGVTLTDAMTVLAWSQQDEFWRANVQSMPTFREKYDRLRLQAARAPADQRSHNEQILDRAMQRALAAEAGHTDRKAIQ